MATLAQCLHAFRAWSANADRESDGWQQDFPQFQELIDRTIDAMIERSPLEHGALAEVEEAWCIGCDFAASAVGERPETFREWVQSLALSQLPPVRLQAYTVLGRWRLDRAILADAAQNDPHLPARRTAVVQRKVAELVSPLCPRLRVDAA